MNPLIAALHAEREVMMKPTLVWRRDRGYGLLRAPKEYLLPNAQMLLDDLLANTTSDLADDLEEHGKAIEAFRQACQAAHESLISDAEFVSAASELARREDIASTGIFRSWNNADFSSLPANAATRIVNGLREIEPTNGLAPYWSAMNETYFAKFASKPEVVAAHTAKEHVVTHAASLIASIESQRTRLCDRYDIPPAPAG